MARSGINEAMLASMSLDELLALRDSLNKLLTAKAEDLRDQLAKVRGGRAAALPAATNRTAKYQGPNGETWVGRGARPRWLAEAIMGGATLEDFAIEEVAGKKRGRKPRQK